MRPFLIAFFLICIIPQLGIAQKNAFWECHIKSDSLSKKFAETFYTNRVEAIRILDGWEKVCRSRRGATFSARLILRMDEGRSPDSLLASKPAWYFYYTGYEMRDVTAFDTFAREFFARQYSNQPSGTLAHIISEYYGVDARQLMLRLQDTVFVSTEIGKKYRHEVSKYLKKPEAHAAGIIGVWMPTGGARRLGRKAEFGYQAGVKHKKMSYDLTFLFRRGEPAGPYIARRTRSDDSLIFTSSFLGSYLGFDLGRDVYSYNGNYVQAIIGIGADGFDAIEQDTVRHLKGESVWSYNVNLGLEYRHFISHFAYVGLRARYNVVDYRLNNVVDFTGNSFSIAFTLGGLMNNNKRTTLEKLRHSWGR